MRRLTITLIVAAAISVAWGGVADAHRLKYERAKRAAQNRADAHAGQRTTVYLIVRDSNHRFYAEAEWTRVNPTGCQECAWDPATGTLHPTPTIETCYVDLNIRFQLRPGSRRVRTFITSSTCH